MNLNELWNLYEAARTHDRQVADQAKRIVRFWDGRLIH